jgi:uncharacterized protein (DUF2249 family)
VEPGDDPGRGAVIRRTDRVADVLARDPALLDVLVAASPAFERLRNPAMRRVMARLVTVEQAARIGGADPAALVDRLNGVATATRGGHERSGRMGSMTNMSEPAMARPTALDGVGEDQFLDLDVRDDLRSGREPFSRIMEARRALPEGGVLRLRAIFEPVPLYGVFRKQGFEHWTERLAEDDWRIWFYPAPEESALRTASADAPMPSCGGCDSDAGEVVVLDVRGLEPPEPMVRTLAALDALPHGHTLVQVNVKEPKFLLPQLEERGFRYEVREQEAGLVRVFIRHAEVAS